tara:strand:+ start:3568 stop:3855 length:288 start_codon:yes stop_codon:yes gene_type:complete
MRPVLLTDRILAFHAGDAGFNSRTGYSSRVKCKLIVERDQEVIRLDEGSVLKTEGAEKVLVGSSPTASAGDRCWSTGLKREKNLGGKDEKTVNFM